MPIQTGTGKNGTWKKCEFIIETQEKYPKKICFSAWNDQADEISNFNTGTPLEVHFDVSSREYNSRWYTDVKAWKILPAGTSGPSGMSSSQQGNYGGERSQSSGSSHSSQSSQPAQPMENDDLPF